MAGALIAGTLTSCFTGVESTPKVTVTRGDMGRIRAQQREDWYLDTIKPQPMADWKPGKKFYVTDDRVALTFLQEGMPLSADSLHLFGSILQYSGAEQIIHPDGQRTVTLRLTSSSGITADNTSAAQPIYRFDTGLDSLQAASEFNSYQIEMLIDIDAVTQADKLMRGNKYWTRSPIWYTPADKPFKGRKYVPVTVDSVSIGNLIFPLKVYFTDEKGEKAYMLMNLKGTGSGSRSFANLFYLEDIRPRYQHISPTNWQLICEGRVAEGMTKEECRLSLGYPQNIESGFSTGYTIDIWQYDGGRYLRFEDGLLTKFN